MNMVDVILLILIAAALIGAVLHCIKERRSGRCHGCCGDCSQCQGKF